MHSVAVDRNGSPTKRTLSRGMSEDESLRFIITETESPSRRLARSDSRGGTLKRKSGSQQCDQDVFKTLPDVMELQASYEEVVQELHGLELEREALLFQVDVLQDSLESVEELLAEAHREASQARTEAEQERMSQRRLEDTVRGLMSEVERLREEKNTLSTLQANALLLEEAKAYSALDQAPITLGQAPITLGQAPITLGQAPITLGQAPSGPQAWGATAAGSDQGLSEETRASLLQKMVSITRAQVGTLALDEPCAPEGVLGRAEGVLDRAWGRRPEEDEERNNDTDSVSAYEDASADTPELDHAFPGPGDDDLDGGEDGRDEGTDPKDRDPNSSCTLS